MVLKAEIGKELEQKFRRTAMNRYGYAKGSLQKATKEAIGQWVKQQSDKIPVVEDPFPYIMGLLKDFRGKKTSVDLQHEARDVWTKKYS